MAHDDRRLNDEDRAVGEVGEDGRWDFMPSPQVAALAVLAMLGAGVILGSLGNPFAQGARTSSIVLEADGGGVDEAAEEAPSEGPAGPLGGPAAYVPPSEPVAPAPEAEPAAGPEPAAAPPQLPPNLPEEPTLPEIRHVFLVVLADHGYGEAFGDDAVAPYLDETLTAQGKLLANYYAVSEGGLANEVALLSGQGPTPQTVLDCPQPTPAPVTPGTLSPDGQVEGDGCVYPAEVETLPEQLEDAHLTWKAYVEEGPLEPWRRPFDYFSGLAEDTGPADGTLGSLVADLSKPATTPAFSYIVPSSCHDGSEVPCAPDQSAGLAGAAAFLEAVVPEIVASPAYEEGGGLIAITFDSASQGEPDTSSCCAPVEFPNLPPPPASAEAEPAPGPVKPSGGGGRVGMLLISPFVAPGTVDETGYYNHFSFLRSVEELFGLQQLGYAAEPALAGFDASVFDASSEAGSGMKR